MRLYVVALEDVRSNLLYDRSQLLEEPCRNVTVHCRTCTGRLTASRAARKRMSFVGPR